MNGKSSFFSVASGIDPDLAREVKIGEFRKTYPLLARKRILLFLGRLHWSKGLEVQARAIASVLKEDPDVMWVLVGPDDGEWESLSRLIKTLGLERHVLWTGPLTRRNCLQALADADVFLLTSRHEAHSMAMNEALAIGVPLIMTDTVGFNEVAKAGAGKIVPWDSQAVATVVVEVLRNRELALEMGEAGRRLAAGQLAWPKIAAAMAEQYSRILARPVCQQPPP
jgi:glycosyltransferase involved in cell wall biosynthesis